MHVGVSLYCDYVLFFCVCVRLYVFELYESICFLYIFIISILTYLLICVFVVYLSIRVEVCVPVYPTCVSIPYVSVYTCFVFLYLNGL